jgi:hypothetical protein
MVSPWPANTFAGPLAVWERSPQLRAWDDRDPPVACLEPPAVVEIPHNSLHADGRSIWVAMARPTALTGLCLAGRARIAAALRFHSAALIARRRP